VFDSPEEFICNQSTLLFIVQKQEHGAISLYIQEHVVIPFYMYIIIDVFHYKVITK